MTRLKERILDIAYKNKLSHLGSHLSSVDIIDEIYSKMGKSDIFILSSGHAALALYVVLEKYCEYDAQGLFDTFGGHPKYCPALGLYCSTGSLGMGITVAVGRALANKNITVHCLLSDGECAEGSVWEALRFIQEKKLKNIKIYVNINGYAAYDPVDKDYLIKRLKSFYDDVIIKETTVNQLPFLCGLNAHYKIMTKEDYDVVTKMCPEI